MFKSADTRKYPNTFPSIKNQDHSLLSLLYWECVLGIVIEICQILFLCQDYFLLWFANVVGYIGV